MLFRNFVFVNYWISWVKELVVLVREESSDRAAVKGKDGNQSGQI
jgi:hypothetical protein